ncbi:hypothetical protein Misp01_41060 [Microtetraspora sp. NBRC 13810]|uniref:hypothetical protein n=1 Tax=Microtetraspora sp. NBRC 13810 TaxID=3030990 RepID=UPI002553DC99|nr:hypothetical protein [Microtetraspora sp. NBRC 13810]GLW08976.1 hypothetical protein Misp01_41060 [Microtetraspora sp. NBRC 13810]
MHYDTDGFYSWAATDDSGRVTCGVTGEFGRAAERLSQALDSLAPGATGEVQVVRLDRLARRPSYIYGGTLLRLRRAEPGE